MFASLDFVYLPSRDAAADLRHFVDVLGAELVFAVEGAGTRVAMVRTAPSGPALLLAEHLEGDAPVLVHRVPDLDAALAGLDVAARMEIPHGPIAELDLPGPQRLALYELTRPQAGTHFAGRRDF
jgi:hypothetical protein